MLKQNQRGFHVAEILIIFVVMVVVGLAGWRVLDMSKNKAEKEQTTSTEASVNTKADGTSNSWPEGSSTIWESTGDNRGWIALSNAPVCPNPLVLPSSPAAISKVTSILYPGQTRGGDYKPHGGFRFDSSKNSDITVKSPMPGYVSRGARYLVNGEIQYTFDIINPCGIMVRIGHIRVLSPVFQRIADKFPPAAENDSRTTQINPVVEVKAGDTIATTTGLLNGTPNNFFDFGVYDLRRPNAVSQTTAYQQAHANDKELSWHAVCWFDMLPGSDASTVKGLPAADGASGKTSDYCDASD